MVGVPSAVGVIVTTGLADTLSNTVPVTLSLGVSDVDSLSVRVGLTV
jgi:hypothetical protein